MSFRSAGLGAIVVATSDTPNRFKKDAHYLADGTADEVEINKAIDEAYRNSSSYGTYSGGHVFLMPGTYRLSYPIDMCGRVWLQGSGPGTIIQPNGSNFQSGGTYDGAGAIKLVTSWSTVASAGTTYLHSTSNSNDSNKTPFSVPPVGTTPWKGSWVWVDIGGGNFTKGRITACTNANSVTVASWDNGTPSAAQTWWIGSPPASDGGAMYTDHRLGDAWKLSDFYIMGNGPTNARTVGIQLSIVMQKTKDLVSWREGTPDSAGRAENIWIDDTHYEALTLDAISTGDDCQQCTFTNIRSWNCGHSTNANLAAFRINSPDNFWSNIDVGRFGSDENNTASDHHGFYIDQADNQFVNCKAWFCRGSGFYSADARNRFVACGAQDNNGYGFYLSGSRNVCVGCMADSCNRQNAIGANSAGFYMPSAHTLIVGCGSYNRSSGGGTMSYGYRLADVAHTVISGCWARFTASGAILDSRSGDNLWKSKVDSLVGTTTDSDTGTWTEPAFASNGTMFSGNGAPTTSVPPVGTIYLRRDGGAGSRVYVHAGSGTWNAIASV